MKIETKELVWKSSSHAGELVRWLNSLEVLEHIYFGFQEDQWVAVVRVAGTRVITVGVVPNGPA